MAKLGAFYALCPLIDNKSFFGVSQDSEEGVVITTLGKNMAGRYKVSNQKQISCWRTKDKFSSPVIYDVISSNYVSVFNKSFIRMWDKEVNLDKVRKHKFNMPIHTLFSKNGQSYVVFKNGALYRLEEALENNKTLNPKIPDVEQIEDILYEQVDDEFYYGVIVKTEETHLYWTKYENGRGKFKKIKLERDQLTLAGCVFHQLGTKMNLLTLWSDGAIYSCSLDNTDSDTENDGIGTLFYVIETVSTKYPVSMVSLDEKHLALYGANFNEEGAVFVIYNTKFKVLQSKQPFKLFTCNARMWHIENNVFVPVGQNLAVIPFQLTNATLADLVQSYRFCPEDLDRLPEVVVVGDEGCKSREERFPKLLQDKIGKMVRCGLSEGIILEQLLPDIYENQDIELLIVCLEHFTDIPERHLSKILKYVLDLDSECFSGSNSDLEGLPSELQPSGKTKLIDLVLCRPFDDHQFILPLRADLSVSHLSLIIKYIDLIVSDDDIALPGLDLFETEVHCYEWIGVLIDANYAKLQLCRDQSLIETIRSMYKTLDDTLSRGCYKEEDQILINMVLQKKPLIRRACNSSSYSVELLNLY